MTFWTLARMKYDFGAYAVERFRWLRCLRDGWLMDWYAWLYAASEQRGIIYREDWRA